MMKFTESQLGDLGAPLNRSNVRERSQAGRKVSYIEGWHAIAEANRIFGYDAWSRETILDRCVLEKPRKIGKELRDGWGVSYICKVRITVAGVVRDGIGSGHGIDQDLGLAHESAIKEAETDAMKRALMTFGNQFGLALYDKEQTNVESYHAARAKNDPADHYVIKAKTDMKCFETTSSLKAWWDESRTSRERVGIVKDTPAYAELWAEFLARGKSIVTPRSIA